MVFSYMWVMVGVAEQKRGVQQVPRRLCPGGDGWAGTHKVQRARGPNLFAPLPLLYAGLQALKANLPGIGNNTGNQQASPWGQKGSDLHLFLWQCKYHFAPRRYPARCFIRHMHLSIDVA